jgi:hypothetical protein
VLQDISINKYVVRVRVVVGFVIVVVVRVVVGVISVAMVLWFWLAFIVWCYAM